MDCSRVWWPPQTCWASTRSPPCTSRSRPSRQPVHTPHPLGRHSPSFRGSTDATGCKAPQNPSRSYHTGFHRALWGLAADGCFGSGHPPRVPLCVECLEDLRPVPTSASAVLPGRPLHTEPGVNRRSHPRPLQLSPGQPGAQHPGVPGPTPSLGSSWPATAPSAWGAGGREGPSHTCTAGLPSCPGGLCTRSPRTSYSHPLQLLSRPDVLWAYSPGTPQACTHVSGSYRTRAPTAWRALELPSCQPASSSRRHARPPSV